MYKIVLNRFGKFRIDKLNPFNYLSQVATNFFFLQKKKLFIGELNECLILDSPLLRFKMCVFRNAARLLNKILKYKKVSIKSIMLVVKGSVISCLFVIQETSSHGNRLFSKDDNQIHNESVHIQIRHDHEHLEIPLETPQWHIENKNMD